MRKIFSMAITCAALAFGGAALAQDKDKKPEAGKAEGGCCEGGGCAEGGACCGDEAAMANLGPLEALVGEWVGPDANKDGQPDMTVTYRKTAGGTALIETLFPGTPKEMISVYTKTKDGWMMTHYCLGNQPRMIGKAGATPNTIVFEFCAEGSTNMTISDQHMHSLTLTLTDATHIKHEWTMWKDGKAGDKITFELTKKPAASASK